MREMEIACPLQISAELPYEPPWTDVGDFRRLTAAELQQCCEPIREAAERLCPEITVRSAAVQDGRAELAVVLQHPDTVSAHELAEWWHRKGGLAEQLGRLRLRVKGIGWVRVKIAAPITIRKGEHHERFPDTRRSGAYEHVASM